MQTIALRQPGVRTALGLPSLAELSKLRGSSPTPPPAQTGLLKMEAVENMNSDDLLVVGLYITSRFTKSSIIFYRVWNGHAIHYSCSGSVDSHPSVQSWSVSLFICGSWLQIALLCKRKMRLSKFCSENSNLEFQSCIVFSSPMVKMKASVFVCYVHIKKCYV